MVAHLKYIRRSSVDATADTLGESQKQDDDEIELKKPNGGEDVLAAAEDCVQDKRNPSRNVL